ncbi:MAG: hypothetical protein FJ279_28200, partial [Planctomycetes bacterium]|nr:hypothetical protein [Planctomycetota bacterium]
ALEYILMPTYLELAKPLDLPANTAQRFWLTVHVPEDAAPAIYHGRVTLRAEGAEASIPLRLRVLPFKLDDPPGIAYGPYYRPYQLAKQGDLAAQRDFIRRDLQDMRDHGMTSLGLCVGLDSAKVKMDGDKVDLGLDGTSPFEMALDAYRDLRFPEPVCLLTDGAQSFAGKHKLESDEFASAYRAVTMALNAEAKRRGWPEIILQPVDEPAWQDKAACDRNVRCLQILKQIPGQRTEQDGPGDKYFHEVAGPLADVWNYNGSYASPEVIKKAKAAGKLIWIYNNDVEGYRPEMMRYTAGFHLAATGSDGVFNWEYRGGSGDLYNDFDGQHGDFVFNYLPSKDSTGGPATGWEGFREGIDDQRHIALLRKTIARCRAANKPGAERAEAVLDRVLKSLDYKPGLRGAVKFDRVTVSPEGQKQFRGQFKLPNGWDFSMYDKARWQVAQATLDLMQSLGELPAPPAAQKQDATSQLAIRAVQFVKDEPVTSAGKPRVEAGRPKLTIPEAKSPPIIDGKTTDAAWRRAPEIARMALHEGEGPPTQQTQVWLAFDATHLYLAAWCGEAKIRDLVTNVKSDFGPVWNDDCLELFVDANQDRATYFHVAVNPLGVKWLNLEAEAARNSKVRTAATIAEHGWYCEMAIPLAELGERHAEWGLNVCRERRAGGGLELSCWSPTYGGFGSPERFGDATLGEKFIRAVVLGNVFIGRNVAKVALQNEDPTGVEFALSGRIEPQGGQPPPAVPTVHLSLGPGERKEVDLPFDVSLGAGEQALLVELRRQPDGSLITSRRATFAVPQPMRLSVSPKLLY